MAHNLDAGSFRVNSDATSAVLSRTVDGTDACSVVPRRTGSTHSLQSSGASDLRATAPEFIPCGASKTSAVTKAVIPTPSADPTTDLLGDQKFELDMYGIPWFYYMYQVQFAYNQGFHYGRSRSPKKFGRKKHRSSLTPPIATESMQYASGPAADSISGRDMPPPVSTISLAEQRAQQKHHNSTREVSPHDGASAGDQMFPAFTAQQDVIARETRLVDTTNMPRGPAVDLSTCRNVPPFAGTRNTAPQADYYNTMPARGYHNSRHHFNRSDNGLYSYGGRGTTGVPMHDTAPFPNPIPPQGRPNGGFNDNPPCGAVDVVFAAERVGGEACNVCEPDHPLD
ncbi:hypothetical protein CC86DRAFT_357233 [Ophiobolus disseminans]|uniref:Uncharacterized protein n=1 Tax=Ophiobolus disseminans TaxID=1469910 RepID=A0A6A6ZMT2_9PLEO|nr:hypothetical protein CC86DRAFT_357233 [Ophiobolus disseminans]